MFRKKRKFYWILTNYFEKNIFDVPVGKDGELLLDFSFVLLLFADLLVQLPIVFVKRLNYEQKTRFIKTFFEFHTMKIVY